MSTDLPVMLSISADADALASDVASRVATYLSERLLSLPQGRYVEIAVSGGFTTTAILPALRAYAGALDWSRVRFWWVDERFVPAGDPDRNDEAAVDALLRFLPGVSWVAMPTSGGLTLEEARRSFESLWAAQMGDHLLDLALVGMGPDGHIASLFPGGAWVDLGSHSPTVVAVSASPKPPAERLSLSMPVILASRLIILATGGESKREAMTQILGGAAPALWPAAALLSGEAASRTVVCMDEAATPQAR